MCACGRTFSELSKPEELLQKCKDLCENLAESLTEEELKVCMCTLLALVIEPTSCSPVYMLPSNVYSFAGPHSYYKVEDGCF